MDLVRNIFQKKRAKPTPSPQEPNPTPIHEDASEQTLVASSPVSRRCWTVLYLKTRSTAIGRHILERLNSRNPSGRIASSIRTLHPLRTRYHPTRLLGSGGNGQVYLCRDIKKGTLVAVKTIYHDHPLSLPIEAHTLQQLDRHPNIIRYHRSLSHPTIDFGVQLVFEYCEMGDLADYVNQGSQDHTPEVFIWHVFKHIVDGLNYVHSQGIVHGDLKPANILLAPPRDGDVYPLLKLADFGAATVNPPRDVPLGHLATMAWQPPGEH
jgi:serine/threonine protein kinase